MTSLATQLKQLSLPGVNIGVELKKRKSLLFDSQKAASLDCDAFYGLGRNGFEGVCSNDPTLYADFISLFNESAKGTERSILLVHENEELDTLIKNFLCRISPFFMTRSSQKCLEWLIYRFRIEEFNANDLLLSFLPYFGTKLYARLLQLFDVSSLEKIWSFIEVLQKEDQCPGIAILVEQCIVDRGFFTALCGNVLQTIKAYGNSTAGLGNHPSLNLYVVCTMELLFNIRDRHEEFIAQLMPFVAKGLESDSVSHKASSYMIICGIAANMKLGKKVIFFLIESITRNYEKKLESEYLSALTVLCQTQENVVKLPKECVELISSSTTLLESLRQLNASHDIEDFLRLLIEQLICLLNESHNVVIIVNTLDYIFENFFISRATSCKVAIAFEFCNADKNIQHRLLELLFSLEKKYPEILLETLSRIEARGGHDESVNVLSKMYLEFINNKVSTEQSIIPYALHETSALSEMIYFHPEMVKSELLRNVNIGGLSDVDSSNNILKALQKAKGNFDLVFHDPEEAFVVLLHLLYGRRFEDSEIVKVALELLLSDRFVSSDHRLSWNVTFVACDLILNMSLKSWAGQVSESPFVQSRPWLSKLSKKKDAPSFLACLLEILKDLPERIVDLRNAWIRVSAALQKNRNDALHPNTPFYFVLNFAALKVALSGCQISDLKTAETVFEELTEHLQNLIICFPNITAMSNSCRKNCSSNAFKANLPLLRENFHNNEIEDTYSLLCIDAVLNTFFECLEPMRICDAEVGVSWEKLARESNCDDESETLASASSVIKSKFCYFFLKMLSVTKSCKHLVRIMRTFVPVFFSSPGNFVCYLAQYWTAGMKPSTSGKIAAQALHLAFATLKNNSFEVSELLSAGCILVPSLIVAMAHGEEAIRVVAMKLLLFIHNTQAKTLYSDLLAHLVSHADILVVDHASLPKVLSLFFSANGKASIKRNRSVLDAVIAHNILPKCSPVLVRLTFLQGLQSINSKALSRRFIPVLKEVLDMCCERGGNFACEEMHIASLVDILLSRIEGSFLTDFDIKSTFYKALRCNANLLLSSSADTTPQLLSLRHITREFFSAVNDDIQSEVIDILLDISLQNSRALEEVRKVFKRIQLSSAHVSKKIDHFTGNSKESLTVPAKKAKTDEASCLDPAQRLVHLLEFLQEKKKIINQQDLLPPLFALLEATLDNSVSEHGEYIKQLLLSILLKILRKLRQSKQSGQEMSSRTSSMCKIEILVHCVRSTEDTQTQHHSLMLLSEIASLFPEKVLHNVMALFTFMGSHTLRKDDPYSFNIISMTMRNVIPALIKTNFGAPKNKTETIVQVFRTFVDALPHMPSHRKLLVLSELLSILGGATYSWILLLMLISSCVPAGEHEETSDVPAGKVQSGIVPHGTLSFQAVVGLCGSVCNLHPLDEQMASLLQCLEYLLRLPLGDEEMLEWRKGRSASFQVIEVKTATQLRRYYLILLVIILRVIETNRESIISKLKNPSNEYNLKWQKGDEENLKPNDVISLLQSFYERLFHLIFEVYKHTGKLSKALVSRVYDVISQINTVLPFKFMIDVIDSLLDNPSPFIRRKALDLFAGRVASTSTFAEEELHAVERISKKLAGAALTLANSEDDSTGSVMLCHSSLVALKIAIRGCGKARPGGFTEVLQCLCNVVSHPTKNVQVLSAAFLCFAEMCSCLRAYCIPYLNSFVPAILLCICESRTLENETLLFSCITAMHRLLENLTDFLSAYVEKALAKIAALMLLKKYESDNVDTLDDGSLPKRISLRLNAIVSILASKFSSYTLIAAVGKCLRKASSEGKVFLTKPLCVLLLKHIEHLDKQTIMQCSFVLFPLLYELLDFRRDVGKELPVAEISVVEEYSCEVVATAFLKLPENSFRTCFFELFDWATNDDNQGRLLTYYKLVLKLSKKMKALFSLFAGRIIEGIGSTLCKDLSVGFNNDEVDGQELLELMCDTMSSILFNDTSELLNKQRFELLLQPLIDQIEVLATCQIGDDRARTLLCDHVIPCIAQLSSSVVDSTCRKLLNHKTCIKSRSSSPKVRFYALKTLEAVAEKLGEEYSIILPETIPFLSELMEDDVEEVETECHSVIKRIEGFVNEPLQKYFSMY